MKRAFEYIKDFPKVLSFRLIKQYSKNILAVTYPEIFLGIPFSAGDFRAGAQKDTIVKSEE